MSVGFEDRLDKALDTRSLHRRQEEAKQAQSARAIQDAHTELERKKTIFRTKVRSLIEKAVERANHHLDTRLENWQLHELSEAPTPWYPGGPACTPIAFEMRIDGRTVGEMLIVELMHHGMVEASFGKFHPSVSEGHLTRRHYRWPPIPVDRFDAREAHNLVLRFIAAIVSKSGLEQNDCGGGSM